MRQHSSVPRALSPSPHRSGRLARLAVGALAVGLAAAACSSGPADEAAQAPEPTSTTDPGGSGPAAPDSAHAHADAGGDRVPVGPLALFAADYWSVIQPEEGLAQVRAGGCPEGQNCPSFEVLSGDALDGVDPAAAYLPEGVLCPGNGGHVPASASDAGSTTSEVGGQEATLTRFTLSCVDDAGTEVFEAEQLQWFVADGPAGPTLVVDRWAFEGLESRLAAATW